jgi:HSP20 family protein
MKKDLTVYSASPMRRLFEASRFNDIMKEFDNVLSSWDIDMKTFSDLQPKTSFPKVNVSENDDSYEVEIAIAGFDKEDINLELKDNCICIKADKKQEHSEADENKKYLMKEISSRSFRRVLNIPKKVLTNDIECIHKDGIIKCVLKKEVESLPENSTIKIDIK